MLLRVFQMLDEIFLKKSLTNKQVFLVWQKKFILNKITYNVICFLKKIGARKRNIKREQLKWLKQLDLAGYKNRKTDELMKRGLALPLLMSETFCEMAMTAVKLDTDKIEKAEEKDLIDQVREMD